MDGRRIEKLAIICPQNSKRGLTEPYGPFENCIEHRREIAWRGVDDLQYLGGRGLSGQRCVPFGIGCGKLALKIAKLTLQIDNELLGIG
jgi:hypothetical protein